MTGMTQAWTLSESGVAFEGGPATTFRGFSREEFEQWLYAMDRASSVFAILETAKAKFEGGQVDYSGACIRLRKLLDEYEKAAAAVAGTARATVTFFSEVPGLQERFAQLSAGELDKFVREALPLLQKRLEKPAADAASADTEKSPLKLEP